MNFALSQHRTDRRVDLPVAPLTHATARPAVLNAGALVEYVWKLN